MEYRKIRDMKVSEVGFGLYSLAGVYGKKSRTELEKVLLSAVDNGVTLSDGAPSYCGAEEFPGTILRPHRSSILVSTKTPVGRGGEVDLSASSLLGACHGSLKRLGTDHIEPLLSPLR